MRQVKPEQMCPTPKLCGALNTEPASNLLPVLRKLIEIVLSTLCLTELELIPGMADGAEPASAVGATLHRALHVFEVRRKSHIVKARAPEQKEASTKS